jgi:hypothetical protein
MARGWLMSFILVFSSENPYPWTNGYRPKYLPTVWCGSLTSKTLLRPQKLKVAQTRCWQLYNSPQQQKIDCSGKEWNLLGFFHRMEVPLNIDF